MKKADLRKSLRAQLLTVPPEARAAASRAICNALTAHPRFQDAKTVLLFAPQQIEPDLDLLWDISAVTVRKLVYPRIHNSALQLCEVQDLSELVEGRWKLREPMDTPHRIIPPERIDFAVVPGVAFSRRKERLGRGGGYYDRLLAQTPQAFKAGVCFDFQLFDKLPVETHDIHVDAVISSATGMT